MNQSINQTVDQINPVDSVLSIDGTAPNNPKAAPKEKNYLPQTKVDVVSLENQPRFLVPPSKKIVETIQQHRFDRIVNKRESIESRIR